MKDDMRRGCGIKPKANLSKEFIRKARETAKKKPSKKAQKILNQISPEVMRKATEGDGE